MKPKKKSNYRLNPLGLRSTPSRPLPKSSRSLLAENSSQKKFNFFRRRKFKFTWKKLALSLGIFFGFLVLSATSIFAYYVRELPNPKKIQSRAIDQSSQIYDRNGKNLYNIHGEVNRTVIKSDEISPFSKQATVAVEDSDFYSHHGFSLRGIVRAVRDKFTHQGAGGGGSTITQQYIKNALVGNDQTIGRKLKELILAIEVEQLYGKEEILTGYLNEISYGGTLYGIESASDAYFGKKAKDLTLSEAATLAGIPQQPTYYSPYGNHLDDLFDRKNYILDRMVKTGSISQVDADKAKKEAPNLESISFKKQDNLQAPHFVFYVREKLIEILGGDPQLAEKKLDTEGYKVTTSLDLDTQGLAQKIVSEMGPDTVKKYNATNAALSAVDPKTGEILAMVGSIDYQNSKSGNTNFAAANLQPGSSFKPIVFATAFGPKYKYGPGTITYDVPTDFGNYKPNNYDGTFRGAITNRQALAGSLNIPAVKNLSLAGLKDSVQTAKDLGISTLNPDKTDYGLSLVLGSGEVKPVEMASAYAGFANGGMVNALKPILKIEKDTQIIQDFTKVEAKKVLEPEVAYEISSILSDNNARAFVFTTKNNLTLPDRPVAAKSGTTENNRDAWTIGYTRSIAVSVWVGNNEANKTMVKGADGSYVAAPIWNRFMREYLKGKPVEQFTRPASIKDITVDKLSGKLPSDQSPQDERITDIFAPWQAPKDFDDIHIKVKVIKGTNKLASDLTPADLVEERIYFTIRSERPDNAAWEQPVQAWARSRYGDRVGAAPTEKDDTYVEGNRATISLVSPTDGSTVSDTFTIQASPGGGRPITQIEFFIDNVSIGTQTAAPWSLSYSAASLSPGSHTLSATVKNDINLTSTTKITITAGTNTDTSPPNPVKNTSASPGKVGAKPIKLSWDNPNNAGLVSVVIYKSSTANSLGTAIKTIPVTPSTNTSTDITGDAGPYYFTIHSVDSKGNENQTSTSETKATTQMLP